MSSTVAARALQRLATLGALRQVDVEFAALLQTRLAASPEVALAGALAMRAVALGHSGFALPQARQLLDELDVDVTLPMADAWSDALRASALVSSQAASGDATPLVHEHGRVALRRYARYEHDLSTRLRDRAAAPTAAVDAQWLQARLRSLFEGAASDTDAKTHATSTDAQAHAADTAVRNTLALITGGPGTGKTTTVARILVLLHELALRDGQPVPRIALAAPTGRAAARMGEAIDATLARDVEAGRVEPVIAGVISRDAQTLHRLLGWQSGRVDFRHDATHTLPFDVVVVDEASMVDLPLMSKLVAAVPLQAKLILIGDPDQLPAVEAGDVLGALCDAATPGAPLAALRVHLTRGYRQAGDGALPALAAAIQTGDGDAAMACLHAGDNELQWRDGNVAALGHALREFALPAYQRIAHAEDPTQALRDAGAMRVLCALRNGPFGAQAWNAWFAEQLGARSVFFHGRLLMITANSYRHGLFNGDVGVVWHDADGEAHVWFDTGNGLRAWSPSQLPAHDSAFATTVHKAQGSEFDRVAVVLPDDDARVLSRELLYTALTRARHGALLWSPQAVLLRAIARHGRRESGLVARFASAQATAT
ncbi:MAG: exodeoxyribonuclease V subunit alpha [Pseudomonadota bacterium]|nr:exodeoxyribonuclease V subunit alpha [Pseudomonadota bacterium]